VGWVRASKRFNGVASTAPGPFPDAGGEAMRRDPGSPYPKGWPNGGFLFPEFSK
jgi:hypothetical protein